MFVEGKWTVGANQTHTALECSWQHITASRPTFFFFWLLSSRKPLIFFISYFFIYSLSPTPLVALYVLFLLQQTAVPAISVLDLVCSLCSLPLFLFRLHLCLLLFTTSLPSFGHGSFFTHGYCLERDVPLFKKRDSILGCSLGFTGKLLL